MTPAVAAAPFARPSDEADLWLRLKSSGEPRAREALFSLFHSYAQSIARRHFLDRRSGEIEFGDLSQLASAGLLEAIDSFDPDRAIPFRAFARRRIAGSIVDGVSKMSEVREQIAYRNRVRRERAQSIAPSPGSLGDLTADEALQALVEMAMGLAVGFMLDDGALYQAREQEAGAPGAYDSLVWKETVGAAVRCIADLPDRERSVIEHHYLHGLKFEQVAALLGLSKGRVSQLHRSALQNLRRAMMAARHFSLER